MIAFKTNNDRYHLLSAAGILVHGATYQQAFDALAEAGHEDPASLLANPCSPADYRSTFAAACASELSLLSEQVASLPGSEAVDALSLKVSDVQRNVETLATELAISRKADHLRRLEVHFASEFDAQMKIAHLLNKDKQELQWIAAGLRLRMDASDLGQRIAELRGELA